MSGPLGGLKVVEFAGIGPAPFAAMVLADLGADVVRIDRPGAYAPAGVAMDARLDLMNRGRRSLALDLKDEQDTLLALQLVARADALIEGLRPGVMERLGLGPDICLLANPKLVYGRMTGWSQTGPLAPRAGHDLTYLALTGVLHAIGPADGPPTPPLNLIGDFGGGGLMLAFGVLAGVLAARSGAPGQVVDAAIVDGVAQQATLFHGLMAMGLWSPTRGTNLLDGGAPFYRCYACADGQFVAVGALEPAFYAALLEGLGLAPDDHPQWDQARWPQLAETLAAVFKTRSRDAWAAQFEATDACVAPVLSFAEAPAHPHAQARAGYVAPGGVTQPAPAPRFSATPAAIPSPPPTPDADRAAILNEWGILGE